MEIIVFTSFLGPLKQEKFTVKVIDGLNINEHHGIYNAGEWAFKLFKNETLVLESQRVKLPGKETFLGHQRYRIIWERTEIAFLNKSYLKREIIFDENNYSFPRLFKPSIDDLKLEFPLRTWIWRRTVKSYCTTTEQDKMMLAIAITIFVWFTWNALPAD